MYTQSLYLGLLIWPVIWCDLALVLEFMEIGSLYNYAFTQELGFLKKLAGHSLSIKELQDIMGDQDEQI